MDRWSLKPGNLRDPYLNTAERKFSPSDNALVDQMLQQLEIVPPSLYCLSRDL